MRNRTGFIQSFKCALEGIGFAMGTERNLKIHSVVAVLVVIAGFFAHLRPLQWVAVVFAIGLVFVTELLNTAIEKLTDETLGTNYSDSARRIKDMAAGACFMAAITATIIGLVVILPKCLLLL